MKPNKIKQAEQITIKRSQINFAAYNPRVISDDARKKLKKNLQTVGLLGGVIWNKQTGNLVSGHQKVGIMDAVNRYNPETGDNDYEFRVELVDFDEKTEKEQNLFMNNKAAQGTYDDDMLRDMLTSGIDYSAAGFEEIDLQLLGIGDFGEYDTGDMFGESENNTDGNGDAIDADNPDSQQTGKDWSKENVVGQRQDLAAHDEQTMESGENHKLDRSSDFYNDTEANQIARHNEVQKIKDRINSQNDINKDGGVLSYVVISFRTPTEKMRFLENYGFDPMAKYINGLEFENKLEFGDEDMDEEN